MSAEDITQKMMRAVEDPASASVYQCDAPNQMIYCWICPEDLRQLPEELKLASVKFASTVFHSLKRLEGKTIEAVVLDNSKNGNPDSHEFNPFGNRFSIKVITK